MLQLPGRVVDWVRLVNTVVHSCDTVPPEAVQLGQTRDYRSPWLRYSTPEAVQLGQTRDYRSP